MLRRSHDGSPLRNPGAPILILFENFQVMLYYEDMIIIISTARDWYKEIGYDHPHILDLYSSKHVSACQLFFGTSKFLTILLKTQSPSEVKFQQYG